MQYSPKLKKVMADVLAILKKNDIAGICVLYDTPGESVRPNGEIFVPGFSEYLFHINTSYSVAQMEGDRLKIRGKSIHYPSKEYRDAALAKSYNMITHLRDVTSQMAIQAANIHGLIKRMVDSNDEPGTFTSHESQNN